MTTLPVNIDATYADSGTDATVALHQQHHDYLHAAYNNGGVPQSGRNPLTGMFHATGYGALFDGSTDDSVALRAALAAAKAAGGGVVLMPPGTAIISKANHPVHGAPYACALAVATGVTLRGSGAGVTILKLKSNETFTSSATGIIYNDNLNGGDADISFEDFTLDGNAANQSVLCHGIVLVRTVRAKHHRVKVKDVYGLSEGLPTETFHFENQLGIDTTYVQCEVVGTATNTATGFSSDGGTNVSYVSCTATGMGKGHGFTHYQCSNVSYSDCRAYKNVYHGFNSEESDDVSYTNCIAGGLMADADGSPYPYARLTSLGNTQSGFVINVTTRCLIVNCASRDNGASGLVLVAGSSGKVVGGNWSDNGDHGISCATPTTWAIFGIPFITGNTNNAVSLPADSVPSGSPYFGSGVDGGVYIAPPGVPASGTVYTNPFPFFVAVYLSGNPVTAVDVGAGIGAATQFNLAPGQKVTLTYSSGTPTWRWFASS